jgi:hypothetical protein
LAVRYIEYPNVCTEPCRLDILLNMQPNRKSECVRNPGSSTCIGRL